MTMGIPPWGRELMTDVGWHHTVMLGTLHPLHWHCPVLSESPHASPHPELVPYPSGRGTVPLFTRTWVQG